MRSHRWHRLCLGALLGGGMLFTSGCAGIMRTSVKDGIKAFITGSVTNATFASQLNDFVLDVFTSNLGFFGSGALDASTL